MVILFKHLRIAMWTVSSHFITPLRRSVSEKVIGIFSVFLIIFLKEHGKIRISRQCTVVRFFRGRPVFRSTLRSRTATEDGSLGEGRREPREKAAEGREHRAQGRVNKDTRLRQR
jgi:hypothetical protein